MSFDLPSVKAKMRTLTVSYSIRSHPRITLMGAWIWDWGFDIRDNLSAIYMGTGSLLLKTGTTSENQDFALSRLQEVQPSYSPADAKMYRPHPAAVYPSDRHVPQIRITGAWLHDWNITVGDRIRLTKADDGAILIKVDRPAAQLRDSKEKKKLERAAADATAMLKAHQIAHPHIYLQGPEKTEKEPTPAPSLTPARRYLLELIDEANRERDAKVATRRAAGINR